MSRGELSFHDHVKLLGYICLEIYDLPGDILEIGVWKGKSLAFMQRLSPRGIKLIGVDPCSLAGQLEDLTYFHKQLLPEAEIVVGQSELSVPKVSSLSKNFKLIHIDGGHQYHNVWLDFLLYERFLVPGGYIVFDDYNDLTYSPEVGQAVNDLYRGGFFDKFNVIGAVPEFTNSFVLQLKHS